MLFFQVFRFPAIFLFVLVPKGASLSQSSDSSSGSGILGTTSESLMSLSQLYPGWKSSGTAAKHAGLLLHFLSPLTPASLTRHPSAGWQPTSSAVLGFASLPPYRSRSGLQSRASNCCHPRQLNQSSSIQKRVLKSLLSARHCSGRRKWAGSERKMQGPCPSEA